MAQCVVELFFKKLFEKNEVEAALQKLDQLTQDEARMAVAQTLGVAHGLKEGTQHLHDFIDFFQVFVVLDGELSTRLLFLYSPFRFRDRRHLAGNQLQRDVRQWLSPPDPSTNHDFVWKAHHTGTASWFFKSHVLTEWKKTGSFLWIHGKRMIFNPSARNSY